MIKTFILYVLISSSSCPPQSNNCPSQWVANGEFYSRQACFDASRQLGANNNPSHFKCIKK